MKAVQDFSEWVNRVCDMNEGARKWVNLYESGNVTFTEFVDALRELEMESVMNEIRAENRARERAQKAEMRAHEYKNRDTGEVLTWDEMRAQWRDEYDGEDDTNARSWRDQYEVI